MKLIGIPLQKKLNYEGRSSPTLKAQNQSRNMLSLESETELGKGVASDKTFNAYESNAGTQE